jgi:two-component system chemotaxis response regulator CheB
MKPCRVLIVDDSPTMRALIAATLLLDRGIEIVGEVADPFEARDAIKKLNPDVITLDIEMPRMNGLDFLERLMRLRPTRVIVISSLSERGAATTIRALEMGALECVAKPSSRDPKSFEGLAEKARTIVAARLPMTFDMRETGRGRRTVDGLANFQSDGRIVAIGASMGGVEALFTVLSAFPENCPPTVVAQHMPALFTRSFANRLDTVCKPLIREAKDRQPIRSGEVYLAPGGSAHLEIVKGKGLECRLREGPVVSGHRPSIDALFRSVARAAGPKAMGVILTGMGRDGAEGLRAMRDAGADTIGQDEASSLVYGMPRVAFEIGAVALQLPLNQIGARIVAATNAARTRETCL